MSKITIQPLENSRAFSKVAAMVDYYVEATDDNGMVHKKALGPYDRETFTDARRSWKPMFNGKLGMFEIIKADGTLWKQSDLDEFVKAYPLTYPEGHTKAGQIIDRANIRDRNDPYLDSKEFERFSEEGYLTLDPESVLEAALLDMYRADPEMRTSTGEFRAGHEKYTFKDVSQEEGREEKRMDTKLDAYDLFKAMEDDRDRMVAILRLFNTDPEPNASIRTIRTQLFQYVDDAVTTELDSRTYQARFIEYAKLEPSVLKLRELIALGIKHFVIRERAGIYEFANSPVGSNYDSVIAYFSNGGNSSQLDELKIRVAEHEK